MRVLNRLSLSLLLMSGILSPFTPALASFDSKRVKEKLQLHVVYNGTRSQVMGVIQKPVRYSPPESGSPEPYPAIIILGGFRTASGVLDLISHEQEAEPFLLATLEYPVEFPKSFRFPESLRYAPQAKRMVHETREALKQLIAALSQSPEVDTERLVLIGASFGVPFVLDAASVDDSVSHTKFFSPNPHAGIAQLQSRDYGSSDGFQPYSPWRRGTDSTGHETDPSLVRAVQSIGRAVKEAPKLDVKCWFRYL